MSIRSASWGNARREVKRLHLPPPGILAFLCPALLNTRTFSTATTLTNDPQRSSVQAARDSPVKTKISHDAPLSKKKKASHFLRKLPQQCPGCGAFSQIAQKELPGYYSNRRKGVRLWAGLNEYNVKSTEDLIVEAALENAESAAAGLKVEDFLSPPSEKPAAEAPFCDRCHDLQHHGLGVPIHHPSITSIQATIEESPHKYNHIYHVIDAADFPMSLIPGIHKLLDATPQRSLNRRSKTGRFYHGKKMEISFIITRSDLLAPLKEQVDAMMPYLREVLRTALGRAGQDVRLGNIRCVSSKRNWWTKELKEDIWKRGGGGWMVGKVNVGKSRLFQEIFPKGRMNEGKTLFGNARSIPLVDLQDGAAVQEEEVPKTDDAVVEGLERTPEMTSSEILSSEGVVNHETTGESLAAFSDELEVNKTEQTADDYIDTADLLPPAFPEVDFPTFPLVSSKPGTTASPIRHIFGSGKGELIDLPGLSRGELENYVKPEHRASLVMDSRPKPLQISIQEGQSLLLGGFIRITPANVPPGGIVLLAYPFTPLHPHKSATHKAIEVQTQETMRNIDNIALPEAAEQTKSAGIFPLKWDVTRQRTGPITDPKAVGIKPENLPYRVFSTDILIEGVGWVELVAQVRKRRSHQPRTKPFSTPDSTTEIHESASSGQSNYTPMSTSSEESLTSTPSSPTLVEELEEEYPSVEVFTPEGKFISARKPMSAWLLNSQKNAGKQTKSRPRKSMKGMKKKQKAIMRAKRE